MTDTFAPTVLTADREHRVAVIGDVAGHLGELRAELARLGAADDGHRTLPDDLVVVQVGDLIHRGPDSDAVLALVDGYLDRQPDRWLQLVGNHEANYLGAPFRWPRRISRPGARLLARWWRTGAMRVAAVVATPDQRLLITHAGLTAEFWRVVLGAPAQPDRAAELLNDLIGRGDETLFRAGRLLLGGSPNLGAGPVWAAVDEVITGWLARPEPMPFSQVHGHTMINDLDPDRLGPLSAKIRIEPDPERRHEVVTLPGGRLIGIDPGHGEEPRRPWSALVFGGPTTGRAAASRPYLSL